MFKNISETVSIEDRQWANPRMSATVIKMEPEPWVVSNAESEPAEALLSQSHYYPGAIITRETPEQREARLEKARQKYREKRANEDEVTRRQRLDKRRNRMKGVTPKDQMLQISSSLSLQPFQDQYLQIMPTTTSILSHQSTLLDHQIKCEPTENDDIEEPMVTLPQNIEPFSIKQEEIDISNEEIREPQNDESYNSYSISDHEDDDYLNYLDDLNGSCSSSEFHCKECDKYFISESLLLRHLLTHTEDRPYRCDGCDKTFRDQSNMINHKKTHIKEKPFKCPECEKSFRELSYVQKHIMRMHSGEPSEPVEGPYKCDHCEKSFRANSFRERHMRTHTGERPFACLVCGKSFKQKVHLKQHSESHQVPTVPEVRPFKCTECNKTFRQKYHLMLHTRTHTGERPFVCNFCDKSFPDRSHLNSHVRIHSTDRPFKCSECVKSFKDRSNLNSHFLRKHRLNRPCDRAFECDECEKTFIDAPGLSSHKLVHSNMRPFDCSQCGKRFKKKNHMMQHALIHTGVRPFGCDECDKRFVYKSNLTAHKRVAHGIIISSASIDSEELMMQQMEGDFCNPGNSRSGSSSNSSMRSMSNSSNNQGGVIQVRRGQPLSMTLSSLNSESTFNEDTNDLNLMANDDNGSAESIMRVIKTEPYEPWFEQQPMNLANDALDLNEDN